MKPLIRKMFTLLEHVLIDFIERSLDMILKDRVRINIVLAEFIDEFLLLIVQPLEIESLLIGGCHSLGQGHFIALLLQLLDIAP